METQDTHIRTPNNHHIYFYYKYLLRLRMHLQRHQNHTIKFNSTIIMSSKQFLVLLFGVMLLIITSSWADHSQPRRIGVATVSSMPQEVPQPMFEWKSQENQYRPPWIHAAASHNENFHCIGGDNGGGGDGGSDNWGSGNEGGGNWGGNEGGGGGGGNGSGST